MSVSVVIPYRDSADTIEEAIASIQSEPETKEIIVVDDHSTDDSRERVLRLAASDPRIIPMPNSGRGLVDALNSGVDRTTGEFIARMDADDISIRGRFAAQIALLQSDPSLGVVGTAVEGFPIVGEGLQRFIEWQNTLTSIHDHERDRFVDAPLCHPSTMIRRSTLLAVGGYREVPWPEDWDLWLRLYSAGYQMAKVARVFLRWRHHPKRTTFTDPRCAPARLVEARAHYLQGLLRHERRSLVIWGAGKTGKQLARALEPHGIRPARFVDIDPKKMGRICREAPIHGIESLTREHHFTIVAVGARGARQLVRAHLEARGFIELRDFICAA